MKNKGIEFFPYTVIRSAGLPTTCLNTGNDARDELLRSITKQQIFANDIEQEIDEVERVLFESIKHEGDFEKKRLLVKIKRKITRRNFVSNGETKILLGQELSKKVEDISQRIKILEQMKGNLKAKYDSLIAQERKNLKLLTQAFPLNNALLFSSAILSENIHKYNPTQGSNNKKFKQLEFGIIKYATRICFKTSPLSTFTTVGLASFTKHKKNDYNGSFVRGAKSVINFNSTLHYHVGTLLFTIKEIRALFWCELNETTLRHERNFSFFYNKNNNEVFQSLQFNQLNELIYKILNQKKGIRFSQLIDKIYAVCESEKGSIENYLLDLVSHGFIEIGTKISYLDANYLTKVIRFLAKLKLFEGDKFSFLETDLNQLLKLRQLCIKQTDPLKKKLIISEAHSLYVNVINKCVLVSDYYSNRNNNSVLALYRKNNRGKFVFDIVFHILKEEKLMYEDVAQNVKISLKKNELEDVINKIDLLNRNTEIFKYYNSDRFKLLNFFRLAHGSKKEVSLLNLYESYYKHIRDNPTENSSTSFQHNKLASARNMWGKTFVELIKARKFKDPNNADFSLIELQELNRKINLNPRLSRRKESFSTFAQIYIDKGSNNGDQIKIVINSTLPGNGKAFSRFLGLFPKSFLKEMQDLNNMLINSDEILVENSDASIFNANIHPPILDYEIKIPGTVNLLNEKRVISIKDLYVKLDDKGHKLILFDKKLKKNIIVCDLGLQGINSRSHLYKLLETFSNAGGYYLQFKHYLNKVASTDLINDYGKVEIKPRIIFDENIIIQRKTWFVPKECLPNMDGKEFDVFLSINKWRVTLGIPDEIFIRIGEKYKTSSKSSEKKRGDNYKPQYINFGNPLLVNFFQRILTKMEEAVIIEEMLPNSEQLIRINGEPWVTEYIFQWLS